MKIIYCTLFILFSQFINAQIQIGQDIDGDDELDRSGTAVAFSDNGSIVAIGAPRPLNSNPGTGSVTVYVYNDTDWVPMGQKLKGKGNINSESEFGFTVDLSSDGLILAIGIPGKNKVKIYNFIDNQWIQLGNDIEGDFINGENALFGGKVSLSDDGYIISVGAYGQGFNLGKSFTNGHGYVRSYKYNSNNNLWEQLGQQLNPIDVQTRFGTDISLSSNGKRLAVVRGTDTSNPNINPQQRKAVIIYEYDGSQWQQLGNEISGFVEPSRVALTNDGLTVAIGSPGFQQGKIEAAVFVYTFDGINWKQKGQAILGDDRKRRSLGASVSISNDGTILVVGNTTSDNGDVEIYNFNGTKWVQLGNRIYGESFFDISGSSNMISGDGKRVAIGAPNNDANGMLNSRNGHVRVYEIPNIEGVLSVPEINLKNSILPFPNPTKDIFYFTTSDFKTSSSVRIYSSSGKLLFEQNSHLNSVNLKSYPDGLFFIEIISKNGSTIKKVIKKS